MASEIVDVVRCVAECTVAPIVKQVKYVLDYKENMTNLLKEVQTLMDLKQEVEGLVSSAVGNAEDIKPSVEEWVKEAGETAEAAHQIIQEEEESKTRCFIGLCPNPISRRRSSRKAFKEKVQILQVESAGRWFTDGCVSFPVSVVPSFAETSTSAKGFLSFNSRSETWEEIMKALKDPDTNVIGVYGMGGLGKTTLVNKVVARAAKEKLFDEVIVPVVTEKNVMDVKEFQEEMAKVLNMKLDDQWKQWNVPQRAYRIFKRLTQKAGDEKKTIVILDDLRAKLDLEQVGIPFGAGTKSCKILLTSRFLYVSYIAQTSFTLGVLEEEEAWKLFQKIAGNVLEEGDFYNIGKEVTKNCKGLPILIVTVAGALLQRKSSRAWKDASTSLEREGSKEMQEFVYSALEFISFNHLPDVKKSLFLLCGALGGGEISIFDQLLKLGIGWGLFKHTKTVEEARNNLESLILDLKASFLLLDGQSVDTVRMHDVVRDVAIKIASNEGHNMLLGSSDNWPEDDVLNRCTALTFPYDSIPSLPECLVCPSLEFLLLYHNRSSLKITDNLFEKMQELRVLDIRSADLFPKLPSSLAFLVNLHTLSLNLCKLSDISIVGELKKLKILSLNSTGIVVLPMEIGNLSELRVLDLYGCLELTVIPPGIMQRLSRLEELHMAKSFSQWEVEGLGSSEKRNISLDELNYLVNLTTLRIDIPDAKLLPRDFCLEKLERFTILIGDEKWDWSCHDEQSLYSFYPGRHTTQLRSKKELILAGMFPSDLDKLTDYGGDSLLIPILEKIESLNVRNCPGLPSIVQGLVSFQFLTELHVSECDGLVNLVQFSTAKSLVQLTTLKVTGCQEIQEIVASSSADGAEDEIVFSKLKTLDLVELPSLVNFCPGNCTLEFPLLEEVTVEWCNSMKAFCGGITITPKLKTLSLTREKMDFGGDEEDKDLNTIIKKTGIVTKQRKKSEIEEVVEMKHEATKSFGEAESSEKAIQSEKSNDNKAINSRKEAYKVDDELRKEGEFCEEIVEPRKEIITRKARNKGSEDPTVDVTSPPGQSHPALGSARATTSQQCSDFQGLQVTQHLVPLLEKARDKHGDFHTSPLIKLKTVRIIAMETVGQVLHILQTQTPRTINAENIQFMEDAFHDLSNMSFPVEWLHPLIEKAGKCLLSVQRRTVVYELKAKIDEMEAQLQMLKGEMEVEEAKLEEFDEENGSVMDLDQPLVDI